MSSLLLNRACSRLLVPTTALVAGLFCVGIYASGQLAQAQGGSDKWDGRYNVTSASAFLKAQWAQNVDDDDLLSDEDDLLSDEDDLLSEDEDLLSEDEDLLSEDDDLLSEDDDLLSDDDLLDGETELDVADDDATDGYDGTSEVDANAEHAALFIDDIYPSANTCATCHPKQYEEWAVSQHAYAQLSPVYMAMQTTINIKTSGTNGDFCIRCHNQVGMNLNESVYISNLERPATSREGITCVVCHRLSLAYGKESGRFALDQGDIFTPVYGPVGGEELDRVLSKPEEYRVVTDREEAGRAIHTEVEPFFQLVQPSFCGTCHDVTLLNGFR